VTFGFGAEPMPRQLARVLCPSFLNDHFPGDYVRALRLLKSYQEIDHTKRNVSVSVLEATLPEGEAASVPDDVVVDPTDTLPPVIVLERPISPPRLTGSATSSFSQLQDTSSLTKEEVLLGPEQTPAALVLSRSVSSGNISVPSTHSNLKRRRFSGTESQFEASAMHRQVSA